MTNGSSILWCATMPWQETPLEALCMRLETSAATVPPGILVTQLLMLCVLKINFNGVNLIIYKKNRKIAPSCKKK